MSAASFAERVNSFWDWFTANEKVLSELTQYPNPAEDSEQVVEFVNAGLSLLCEGINFNIGGDHEFTFAVSGAHPLFFLLPYVTANLPEQFRDKRTFNPYMPGTDGQVYGFKMHGIMVNSDKVMVSATADEESRTANLRFYAKEWEPLDDDACYGAFYILMEICVGEALAAYCIGEVHRADKLEKSKFSPKKGMFPLNQLEKWLLDNLREDGAVPNPADNYYAYRLEPQESDEPRLDILVGSTSCLYLVDDYCTVADSYYKTFTKFGANPIFLSYFFDNSKESGMNEAFLLRNDLMDKLEEEVLGKHGSGSEIGVILGGAMGLYRAYIEILLFDEQAFLQRAKPLLAEYPIKFFCNDFVRGGQEHKLCI